MKGREPKRCAWAPLDDGLYLAYHDNEWGVPRFDGAYLFEKLVLEGFQAGLSWRTILHKRENFRRAFDGFDMAKVAAYGEKEIRRLLADSGIVRNKLKVQAAINNAAVALKIEKEPGGLGGYLWGLAGGKPLINHFESMAQVPASTGLSDKISRELKKRGFKFIGSTTIYAFMQSVGMVNDHTTDCFRHEELTKERK